MSEAVVDTGEPGDARDSENRPEAEPVAGSAHPSGVDPEGQRIVGRTVGVDGGPGSWIYGDGRPANTSGFFQVTLGPPVTVTPAVAGAPAASTPGMDVDAPTESFRPVAPPEARVVPEKQLLVALEAFGAFTSLPMSQRLMWAFGPPDPAEPTPVYDGLVLERALEQALAAPPAADCQPPRDPEGEVSSAR